MESWFVCVLIAETKRVGAYFQFLFLFDSVRPSLVIAHLLHTSFWPSSLHFLPYKRSPARLTHSISMEIVFNLLLSFNMQHDTHQNDFKRYNYVNEMKCKQLHSFVYIFALLFCFFYYTQCFSHRSLFFTAECKSIILN